MRKILEHRVVHFAVLVATVIVQWASILHNPPQIPSFCLCIISAFAMFFATELERKQREGFEVHVVHQEFIIWMKRPLSMELAFCTAMAGGYVLARYATLTKQGHYDAEHK